MRPITARGRLLAAMEKSNITANNLTLGLARQLAEANRDSATQQIQNLTKEEAFVSRQAAKIVSSCVSK